MATETLGNWLLAELERRGWTQGELARRSHVNRSHISRMISGQRSPGIDALRGMAEALGMPLDDLSRMADEMPPRPARTNDQRPVYHVANNLSERLAKAFGRLGISDQELVVAVAERLAGVVQARIIGDEDG
jgi:transcriptional regulator with XRE-family HTH domain